MHLTKTIRFVLQFSILGLALAFIIILLWPGVLINGQSGATGNNKVPVNFIAGRQLPGSFADAVSVASPAVVSIYTLKEKTAKPEANPFRLNRGMPEKMYKVHGLGSGVIVHSSGLILTNNHVISGARRIEVMLKDGRTSLATVVGTDPGTDIAVLKVKFKKLPALRLGNSDRLRVGDIVLAIGNPYGVGQTVTQGIVSATGRKYLGLNTYENFIQTDAAINPGNSGGALINTRGELIGINTAVHSLKRQNRKRRESQGISFAIPVNLAKKVMWQIVKHGEVIRGWLGVIPYDLNRRLAQQLGLKSTLGVLVVNLYRDSPAHKAGLLPGDVITSLNNKRILDTRHLMDTIADQKPGTEMIIHAVRKGNPFSIKAVVGTRPNQSR